MPLGKWVNFQYLANCACVSQIGNFGNYPVDVCLTPVSPWSVCSLVGIPWLPEGTMRDFTKAGVGSTLPARKACLSAAILSSLSAYLQAGETLFRLSELGSYTPSAHSEYHGLSAYFAERSTMAQSWCTLVAMWRWRTLALNLRFGLLHLGVILLVFALSIVG